jgi:hypothetical protein
MSPYAYCADNPINAIDFLGMDTCKVNKDGTVSPLSQMNAVTCTAPALYKNSITYLFFGELAYGNRQYLNEHKNPYIYTYQENQRNADAELQIGLSLAGGIGSGLRMASLSYSVLTKLDYAIIAGKALADAVGQFGGNLLKGQYAAEALGNINLLSVTLSGLSVNPLSASALSNELNIRLNGISLETNSDNYLWNTAIGTTLGFAGNGVGNLNQYKGLTIGVQMRTALSTNSVASEAAAIGVTTTPTAISSSINTDLSK